MARQWGGGPLRDAGGDLLELLRRLPVETELNLTEEQKQRLTRVWQQLAAEIAQQAPGWIALPPDQRRTQIAQLRERIRAQITENLTREQAERLRQIRLQVDQTLALADKDVADSLELTEEQRTRVRGILGRVRERVRELVRAQPTAERPLSEQELAERVQELRQQAIQESLGLLTPQQRENLERMKGKPLDLGPATTPETSFGKLPSVEKD